MSDTIEIYTDGACSGNPGPGGYAVIWIDDGKPKTINGYEVETTNNRMELQGVYKAIELAMSKISDGEFDEAIIYTDSSYVYNAIDQNWLSVWVSNNWKNKANMPVKNSDLWVGIVKMLRDPITDCISFEKVRGHADNAMNNAADTVAVAMRDKAVAKRIKTDPSYTPPKSYRRGEGYKQSSVYKTRKTRSNQDVHSI